MSLPTDVISFPIPVNLRAAAGSLALATMTHVPSDADASKLSSHGRKSPSGTNTATLSGTAVPATRLQRRRQMPVGKHRIAVTPADAVPAMPAIRMDADGSSFSAAEFLAHVDDTCARVARDTYHRHGRGIIIVDVVTPDDDDDEVIRPHWLALVAIDAAIPSASSELKRLVETYEPERQAIVGYLNADGLAVRVVTIQTLN